MTELDLTYPHHYEIKEPPELPGSGWGQIPVHYFPRTDTRPEYDGTWLHIRPKSRAAWVGVLGFGDYPFSRIFSTPDPERLCVISQGAAYLVNASTPTQWELIRIVPITCTCSIPEAGLLILGTFHMLVAIGSEGVAWESSRLRWDDLRISSADSEHIEGVGFDPTDLSSEMSFSVETNTGRSLLPAPRSLDGKPVW